MVVQALHFASSKVFADCPLMVPLNFSPEARPPPRSSRTRRVDCGIAAMIRFVLFRFVGLINEEEGARHVSEVQPYSRTPPCHGWHEGRYPHGPPAARCKTRRACPMSAYPGHRPASPC